MKLSRRIFGVYLLKKLGWLVVLSAGAWIFRLTDSIFCSLMLGAEISKRKLVYMLENKYPSKEG